MPRVLYETDFEGGSRREFADWLKKAQCWFELPVLPGSSADKIKTYGPDRDNQYALVGEYVARHCQVLIALWDGKELDKVGGTSHVVRYKRDGYRMVPGLNALQYQPGRRPRPKIPQAGTGGGRLDLQLVTPRKGQDRREDAMELKGYVLASRRHRGGQGQSAAN